MKKYSISGAVILALPLALCIYIAQSSANEGNASLTIETLTDSTQTLGRHYTVTRYLDQACKKPKSNSKLLRKKYANDRHVFKPLELPADELFIFQVDYKEKRRDSERSCSASIGVVPQAGKDYKALYEVSGQVSRCTIQFMDITAEAQPIEAEMKPEIMCTRKGAVGNKNGVPTHSMIERY